MAAACVEVDGSGGLRLSWCVGIRRGLVAWLVVSGLWVCLGCTASASVPLPDGRAWEMVSPLNKGSADILGIRRSGGIVSASPNGEEITYVSFGSFAEPQAAPIGSQYLANRQAGMGWLTQNISLPTSNQTIGAGGLGLPYDALSSDLSRGVVFGGSRSGLEDDDPVENRPLAGAPQGYENYYLNDLTGDTLQPLLDQVPSLSPGEFKMQYLDSTSDLGHVIIEGSAGLGGHLAEEGGPRRTNLYDWELTTGKFQLINVLPSGAPEVEGFVSIGDVPGTGLDRAVANDGSRVIWNNNSELYEREGIGTDAARTLQVDKPLGAGVFLTASSDGSKIFFADNQRLTAGSTASSGGRGDLYLFEPDAAEGGRLVDLTVDHADAGGAEALGVLGASEDGSYLYFVANGVLAPGASAGDCVRTQATGTCNLYLWHAGEGIRFIAPLSGNDESGKIFNALGVADDWSPRVSLRTARVSHDGTHLVFMSERSLTGYDNTVSTGSHCGAVEGAVETEFLPINCQEVFLYEVHDAGGTLSCVSCHPNGARPAGPSGIPGGTDSSAATAQYQSRVLAEDGAVNRVFFETDDSLVPQDTNGVGDVYEYENGNVYLLSDGLGSSAASFVDASVNGNDVFFLDRAPLVSQDTDQLVDLYDARAPHYPGESVGFPAPEPRAPCLAEECRSPGYPSPIYAPLSSVQFIGAGNIRPSAGPQPTVKPKPTANMRKAKVKKRKQKPRRGRKAGHVTHVNSSLRVR
jgi:hypothetical protein